jgi:hypothetical protein
MPSSDTISTPGCAKIVQNFRNLKRGTYIHTHNTANMAISRACISSLYTVELLLRTRVGIRDTKDRFTHRMPRPSRAAKGLECVFPIWFTQCGLFWFTLALPRLCHAPTMPFVSRQRHSAAVGTACGRPARYRLLPATTRISTNFVIRITPISDAGGQCETKQRLSWTRTSLLCWDKDMSACIIYSTKIMTTI